MTVHPFVSLDGSVTLCVVIFKGEGITSNMVTKAAAEKIPNLLISTTESGSQDGRSLFSAYEFFNQIISNQKSVVSLSDVLRFCHQKDVRQFLGPPDTTHVTQLLDQINASLHQSYCSHSENLFNENEVIDRQGFMNILASMWSSWATKETIVKAAKKVGISSDGLNWQWMQTDKFSQTEALIKSNK